MNNHGYIRVAAATLASRIGNCSYNTEQIIQISNKALKEAVSILVFPELCITGYTCGDLFFQDQLISDAYKYLILLKKHTIEKDICLIVGLPMQISGQLYNCAAFLCQGKVLGIVPKSYLPNKNEFHEKRWFVSSHSIFDKQIEIDGELVPVGFDILFTHTQVKNLKIGIEICEDLWSPLPPSTLLALNGATLIANLSASNELVGKREYRYNLLSNQSARTISGYIYASAGYGESTTDLVFGGHCLIYENGMLLKENKRFQIFSDYIIADIDLEKLTADRMRMTSFRESTAIIKDQKYREVLFGLQLPVLEIKAVIEPHPFIPEDPRKREKTCDETLSIQTMGLVKRLSHIGCKKIFLGISGGLDSTLALLVCARAYDILELDKKNIVCVTMPGFGTTDRTYSNAIHLVHEMGCSLREISIKEACLQHFRDIGHNPEIHNTTYENVQARERTQILMDLANMESGIVIGTGDLSEIALGWSTYNGDHMSMYSVNASIPKTLIRYLIAWVANESNQNLKNILIDILDTPVSPELLPPSLDGKIAQKTEDMIGPYELHDFFLYQMVRFGFKPTKILFLAKVAFQEAYSEEELLHWLKKFYSRFFSQQFKRSCMPDGPKVGSISLSPRGDWKMPSDADMTQWLNEIGHPF